MQARDDSYDRDDRVAVRVLLPDGGQQMEEPEEEDLDEAEETDDAETEETDEAAEDEAEAAEDEEAEEEAEAESDADEEEAEAEEGEAEDEADEEAEAEEEAGAEEEAPDEREEASVEEGTRLLHLNLDGVYLNLLGLEVDLDEVTLDLTAVTGDGNLLGNLLDAVAGLLESPDLLGLGGSDDGEGLSLPTPELPGLPGLPDLPDLDPMERAREVASAIAERIREMLGEAISALPLEELLAQFLEALVDELLDVGGDGEEADQEEAAASA